jgi:deazaflavin-dependent oxidoreductase (nitroreductase family)
MKDTADSSRFIKPDTSLLGDAHVQKYVETDGEIGHIWNGATVLLLTTTGNKTGKRRTLPLIYGTDGKDFLVVASKGGAPNHPAWYLNLTHNPLAQIQVKAKKFSVKARTSTEAERERHWDIVTRVWPNYDQYVERTTRLIPVVVLSPIEG